jgi:hypothetical protein
MPNFEMYPKWKYKEGESPRLVNTHVEEADLGDTWFDKPDGTNHAFDQAAAVMSATPPGYVAKEYPKWRYSPKEPGGRIVHSEEEEAALPNVEWFDKPDFTNHGEPSTDTTGLSPYQPDTLTGDNVLPAVPEMQQGKAAQRSSTIADLNNESDEDETDEDGEQVEEQAGEAENNFDQANGVNAGDAAPAGNNPNSATGKVTKPATEKQTAEETKPKTVAKKKSGRSADDLL